MLEIGSIVYLKKGSRKVMILNRGPIVKEKVYFDYTGCVYPVGLILSEVFYFNEENIDKVLFHGFHDQDEDRYQELYREWLKRGDVKRGDISDYAESLKKDEKSSK